MTKLIQLNIWGGSLGRAACEYLKSQQADILHLQEVYSSPQGKSSSFDILQNVTAYTKLPHVFYSPKSDTLFGNKRIYQGDAILSRTPLGHTYQEFVHLAYKPDYDDATDDYNIRLFQHAETVINGKKIHLLNYHGYHDHAGKNGNALTDKHCARIAEYMAALDGPKILSGDFNLAPESPSLKPLNDACRNLVIEYGVETTRNQFARSMTPVDFIWVSQGVTVTDFHVAPDLISDHAALVLAFEV